MLLQVSSWFVGMIPIELAAPPCSLQASHVMVLTPQLFLNMLDAGVAHFSQIALLVSLAQQQLALVLLLGWSAGRDTGVPFTAAAERRRQQVAAHACSPTTPSCSSRAPLPALPSPSECRCWTSATTPPGATLSARCWRTITSRRSARRWAGGGGDVWVWVWVGGCGWCGGGGGVCVCVCVGGGGGGLSRLKCSLKVYSWASAHVYAHGLPAMSFIRRPAPPACSIPTSSPWHGWLPCPPVCSSPPHPSCRSWASRRRPSARPGCRRRTLR